MDHDSILNRLAESPVASDEFEEAVNEYIKLMAKDGDKRNDRLGTEVQHALAVRLNRFAEDFSRMATRLGPRRIMELFWFSIKEIIGNSPTATVPEILVRYLAANFRFCPELYAEARARAKSVNNDLTIFNLFFGAAS